jgi:hypothetical protein
MSDIEHVRSELVRIFGSEVADNPRVVAAALTSATIEHAAIRIAQGLELIASKKPIRNTRFKSGCTRPISTSPTPRSSPSRTQIPANALWAKLNDRVSFDKCRIEAAALFTGRGLFIAVSGPGWAGASAAAGAKPGHAGHRPLARMTGRAQSSTAWLQDSRRSASMHSRQRNLI